MFRRLVPFLLLALLALSPLVACGTVQRVTLPVTRTLAQDAVFRLPATRGDKFVVLTIDDAPSSRTDEIVALLLKYGATATFFVHTDQMTPGRRDVLEAAVEAGHEIGNHLPADTPAWKMTGEEFRAALSRADDSLAPFGDGAPPYFRPPHGLYRPRLMDGPLEKFGYDRPLDALGSDRRYILASFIPLDAGGRTNTDDSEQNEKVARRYARQLSGNLFPGAIVVFHDGEAGGREARLAATLVSLETFLAEARARGYDVVSLSDGIARSVAGP